MRPSLTHLPPLFKREELNRSMLQYESSRILIGFQQFRHKDDGQNPLLPDLQEISKTFSKIWFIKFYDFNLKPLSP